MARAKKKQDVWDEAAGEQTENVSAMGGNIKGLQDDIRQAKERIDQWKKERKAINDKIKAERETMETKGITKMAFDAAMHYVDMDADKREGFDTAYIITRESLGAPVKGAQADLFGLAVKADEDVANDGE